MNKVFEFADYVNHDGFGSPGFWDMFAIVDKVNNYQRWMVETFTPRVSHTLVAIELPLMVFTDCHPRHPWLSPNPLYVYYWTELPDAVFTVELQSTSGGLPTGTVLATTTINTADLPLYWRVIQTSEMTGYYETAHVWTWIPMAYAMIAEIKYAIVIKTLIENYTGEYYYALPKSEVPIWIMSSPQTLGDPPAPYPSYDRGESYWTLPGSTPEVPIWGSPMGAGYHFAFREYGYADVGPVAAALNLSKSRNLRWEVNEKNLFNDLRLFVLPYYAAYGINQDSINKFGRRTKISKYNLNDVYSVGLAIDHVKEYRDPKHEIRASIWGSDDDKIKTILGMKLSDWYYIHYDTIGVLDLSCVTKMELSVDAHDSIPICDIDFYGTTALQIISTDLFKLDVDQLDGLKTIGGDYAGDLAETWTESKSWEAYEVVLCTDLNIHLRDNFAYLKSYISRAERFATAPTE